MVEDYISKPFLVFTSLKIYDSSYRSFVSSTYVSVVTSHTSVRLQAMMMVSTRKTALPAKGTM